MTVERRYTTVFLMSCLLMAVNSTAPAFSDGASQPVAVYEGTVELPSYEFSGREMQPPLFKNSTLEGKYPLPPFIGPFKPGGPKPAAYKAIFLENEYLKLTYLPDFGGRIYSLYDKVNHREMFYKNDVMKPANYNMKHSFPLFGIELTGPYDSHMITLYGEPLWFNKVLHNGDGSASLVISTIDPVYRMKVNFTARLVPGLAALELTVFCYNRRDGRNPYMCWISGAKQGTPETRFIYPMTRTIGHTTSEVADWPFYNGVDYSWIKNNRHMLGVFGIDIYDNFQGAYAYDLDYGTFRYADRRISQGMKTWTFGFSRVATNLEQAYTDNGGPYIEVQSGRYVWDGQYEWLPAHTHDTWSEWWLPVAGIGGLTTTSRDVALNLEVQADPRGKNSSLRLGLSAARELGGSEILVTASCGKLLQERVKLAPGKPFKRELGKIAADSAGLCGMVVKVTDPAGKLLLEYNRPDANPGRKEYTPVTSQLEKGQKAQDQMTPEELVFSAETKLKQLNSQSALELLRLALSKDEGYSRAHLALGLLHYGEGRPDSAEVHFRRVLERNPYDDESLYHLALCRLAQGDSLEAERVLYYIAPFGAFNSLREYYLGRLAFLRGELKEAESHLVRSLASNSFHLSAGNLLALLYRLEGQKDKALELLAEVERIDPTNRWAASERIFLGGGEVERAELWRLMGGQGQEAIEVALEYSQLSRWKEALEVLRLVETSNRNPYGTPPVYYYALAYCANRAGESGSSARYYALAKESAHNLDRFPFRPEEVEFLSEAAAKDPLDDVALFNLGCLLYHLGRYGEAIGRWEAAVAANPDQFESRRALGLAYAERGYGTEKAAEQLERAVALSPDHLPTISDLSNLYAKTGRFDRQLALIEKNLALAPGDDQLVEDLISVNLILGRYEKAESLITSHVFAPRHRNYRLRDKYRFMRYGMGAEAFGRGDYNKAFEQFSQAFSAPVSLGTDDFQFESTPRIHYYLGRTLEAMGKKKEAVNEFERSSAGWEYLVGDRDSWNSETFFAALSLEKLGHPDEAEKLLGSLEAYALSRLENRRLFNRSQGYYLLALVQKKRGSYSEARENLKQALEIEPDLLGPRVELRGEVIDPLPQEFREGGR